MDDNKLFIIASHFGQIQFNEYLMLRHLALKKLLQTKDSRDKINGIAINQKRKYMTLHDVACRYFYYCRRPVDP